MKTTMKATGILLVTLLAAGAAQAVELGDTYPQVRAELGEPDGLIRTPERTLLWYERGEIELIDDEVVAFELISEEEAERLRLQREAEEAERMARALEQRRLLVAEGNEVLLRKLDDVDFMNAPAAERLAYWSRFRAQYPGVDVSTEYQAALRERELEVASERAVRRAELASEAQAREDALRSARAEAEVMRQWREDRAYGGSTVIIDAGFGYPHRQVRRPLAVRCGRCGGAHGHALCLRATPRFVPFRSTAGYASQRPLGPVREDRYDDYDSGLNISARFGSLSSSGSHGLTSRPWITSPHDRGPEPISRGDQSTGIRGWYR